MSSNAFASYGTILTTSTLQQHRKGKGAIETSTRARPRTESESGNSTTGLNNRHRKRRVSGSDAESLESLECPVRQAPRPHEGGLGKRESDEMADNFAHKDLQGIGNY